jgi:hypothetical protein
VLLFGIFPFKSFQEYVIQWLLAKCQIDGSFGKQTIAESYAQNPMVLGFIWAFPPAHAEFSVASFFRSALVLQTSWLEDFNLRMVSFSLWKLKWLKVFSLWISNFMNKKPKWLKFKSMCGPLSITWCQRTSEIWSHDVTYLGYVTRAFLKLYLCPSLSD